MAQETSPSRPLWAIPLIAGLFPAVAALVALRLTVQWDPALACNPFIDGCVSISRAARHDIANHVFRALVLPAAVLQGLTWILCTGWLEGLGVAATRRLKVLPWLGVLAAAFLVLYGTFLGTDGEAYRWMRRYGIVFHFGFTCLCMVIAAGQLLRAARSVRAGLPLRLDRVLVGLCVVLLALGLASAFAPLYVPDAQVKDRVENALEWNGALVFTLYFLSLAWLWRATGFRATLATGRD